MTEDVIKVLLVEDDEDDYIITRSVLKKIEKPRYELTWMQHPGEALGEMRRGMADVCLMDYCLGRRTGIELMEEAIRDGCSMPIIMLTNQMRHDIDLAAMKAGAVDFINKQDLRPDLLERAIRYAIQQRKMEEQRLRLVEAQNARIRAEEMTATLEQRVAERTASLLNYQEHLRALTAELTVAEQRERRRLATELHDYLAQLLVAGKMKLMQLGNRLRSEKMLGMHKEILDLVDNSIKYTRTLVAELSPAILFDAGLPAALHWLSEQMEQRHGLSVEFEQEGEHFRLPDNQAILLFYTVRELLINVSKHARVKRARIMLSHQEDHLVIRVCDEGTGFDAKRVTEHSGSQRQFGLFNAQERLEAIGGRMEINSTPGKGSLITLIISRPYEEKKTVAVVVVAGEAKPAESPADRPPRKKKKRSRIRIVLADDHPLVREGLRSVIEACSDLTVIGEAQDGQEAVELAQTMQPDVIVMDVNMPRMNGIEATRQITREYPAIKIIGLSVHEDREMAASMREAGATEYLSKVGPAGDLCRAIRNTRR